MIFLDVHTARFYRIRFLWLILYAFIISSFIPSNYKLHFLILLFTSHQWKHPTEQKFQQFHNRKIALAFGIRNKFENMLVHALFKTPQWFNASMCISSLDSTHEKNNVNNRIIYDKIELFLMNWVYVLFIASPCLHKFRHIKADI